jgi:PEP-CTERM motif
MALLVARPGQAANPSADPPSAPPATQATVSAGKSFLDHASTHNAEEPSYSVPANFPGPLAPQPRRKAEPSAMLLACLGLFVYLGRRRSKALAAAAA